MKGIVFNLLEEVVTREYSADTWDDLLEAAGVNGSYRLAATQMKTFPNWLWQRRQRCNSRPKM